MNDRPSDDTVLRGLSELINQTIQKERKNGNSSDFRSYSIQHLCDLRLGASVQVDGLQAENGCRDASN